MSVGIVNKTTGDRIQTAGNPLDKVGNLANLTTTAKGSAVEAINEVNAGLATKADLTDLAPAFSESTAYTVGQYVSYDGNIYKCTSAHSAGAWVAGDFTLVAVGSELSEINSNISRLERSMFANGIDISSYNTTDNRYTMPNDGYLVGYTSASVIEAKIYGNAVGTSYSQISALLNVGSPVYVRRGMRVYISSNADNRDVYFIPLA